MTAPNFITLNGDVLGIDDAGQVLIGPHPTDFFPTSYTVYDISSGTYTNFSVPSSQFFGSVEESPSAISNAGVVGFLNGPGGVLGPQGFVGRE